MKRIDPLSFCTGFGLAAFVSLIVWRYDRPECSRAHWERVYVEECIHGMPEPNCYLSDPATQGD